MKLIVGLGNPKPQYFSTRHNAGRLLVEFIARRNGAVFAKKKSLQASVAPIEWERQQVILAYPEIFMNVSGEAVRRLVRHYRINFKKELLIAVDDLALPFERLRLRSGGSDGGHNGLRSIQENLASGEYPRLRIGIGIPGKEESLKKVAVPVEEYVLSPFDAAEGKALSRILEKGYEGCRLWVREPLAKAMNAVNPR